jgi:ribokinase
VLQPKPSGQIDDASHARRPRGRRPRLVALGDLVLDIVIHPRDGVVSGSDVAGTIRFRSGGSAANTCRVFAALGGEASFIGTVGDDVWGRRLVAALRADGVRVHAPKARGATARLAALISAGGERSFVTQRGAADGLSAEQLNRTWIARTGALHLPAYSLLVEPLASAAREAAAHARRARATVSVDLASRGPLLAGGRRAAKGRIREAQPDLLFANAAEARALAGRRGERSLLDLSPVVVIKEGAAGCRVIWRADSALATDVLEVDVATAPVAASDTTGAGDAFDAGFLYAVLSSGEDRADALRRAQVLRRAAVAGHRAAAGLLSRPRAELVV